MPRCPSPIRSPQRLRLPVMLAILPLIAACTVGPDYETPAMAVPAKWTQVSDAAPLAAADPSRWWKALNDPGLDALIDDALRGSLSVAAAEARIREARAVHRQAGGTLLPTVGAGASATRIGSAADPAYSQFQAGFDAGWELDLFGAGRRSVEATARGIEAAEEDLRATLLTLVGDIARNYVQARSFQARIALARDIATLQHDTADLTRKKHEAGVSSGADVAKAVGLAISTEANIPTLEVAYAEAVHRLGVLVGRDPSALAADMEGGGPVPAPKLPVAAGVPADVLMSRPDVRRAERLLAQATARVGQAEAARYPSISLTGSIATSGLQFGDLAKSSTIGWSIGPSIHIPIFSGGRLKAAVEIAEAQRDQHHIAFHNAVLSALEDVENALVAVSRERVKLARLEKAAESMREAARLSRLLYHTGATSFLDVLDAERSLYAAEDALLQSRAAIATGYIALNKALGGGWQTPSVNLALDVQS